MWTALPQRLICIHRSCKFTQSTTSHCSHEYTVAHVDRRSSIEEAGFADHDHEQKLRWASQGREEIVSWACTVDMVEFFDRWQIHKARPGVR